MLKSLLTLLLFTLASASITPCYTVALDACNTKGTLQCEIVKIKVQGKTWDYGCQSTNFCDFYKGNLKEKKAQCLKKKCRWAEDKCF